MFRLLCFLSCSVTLGATTVYTDYASWLAAAEAQPNTTVVTETFANNQINTPGLSVADSISNPPVGFQDPGGYITNDEFVGTPYKYSVGATWTFDQPMTAFGADFNFITNNGLIFILDGDGGPDLSPVWGTTYNGFFGFVSSQPFTSVFVDWGLVDNPNCDTCFGQGYTMDNLSIAYDPSTAPEPATSMLFLMGGIIAAALYGRTRLLKYCAIKS